MSSVDQRSTSPVAPPPDKGSAASRTRRRRLVRTLILLVLIVSAFLVVAYSVSLVRNAKQAQASLEAFKTSLQHNDTPGATRHLRDADASLASARHRYNSLPLLIMRHIPVLGWPVSDAGRLVGAATDVSSAGNDALGLYDQVRGSGSKLFHNDRVSLPEVATVTRDADRMVAKMDDAEQQLRAVHGAFWEPGVGSARTKALRQVTSLRSQGRTAQTLLQLTPGLVGANGVRTYLVAVLNPAELQGAGGSALNLLCVRFANGRMRILQSGATSALTNLNTPTHFTPLPDDPWMAGVTSAVLAAVDASPDFRTSGQELMRGYTAQFGVKLDGIIALDPIAMQQLMGQIPPFTTPGYGRVSADNIVKTVLVDSYAKFPHVEQRHLYNDELMTTLLHKILGGGHMIGKGAALRDSAADGHLQLFMNDPVVQQQVASGRLLRTLPAAIKGDTLGVYTLNANASKVDFWQKRSIDQKVTLRSDGSAEVVRTVKITNGAPPYAGAGADPRSGYLTRVSYQKFSTYLPANATLRSFTRDGVAVTPTRFAERGLDGLRLSRFPIERGATMTVVVTYTLPSGTFTGQRYVVGIGAQPMVQPVYVTVSVTGPDSCRGTLSVADMRPGTSVVRCR